MRTGLVKDTSFISVKASLSHWGNEFFKLFLILVFENKNRK